jgi:hypothetical protein
VLAAVEAHGGAELVAARSVLDLAVLEPQTEARAVLDEHLSEFAAPPQRARDGRL